MTGRTQPRVSRRPRLAAGQLRAAVDAHLHAHPDLDLTPADIGRVLDRPHGGVLRACLRLVELGRARQTHTRPRRFRAAIERTSDDH